VEVCLRNEKTANSALVDAIKEIARSRQMTRGDLVNAIEDERGQANLSSARGQYETSLISALPLTIGNASKPASLYFRTSY
jgi:predicted DNA-binding ribbon-helix-helix protein